MVRWKIFLSFAQENLYFFFLGGGGGGKLEEVGRISLYPQWPLLFPCLSENDH